MHYFHSFYKNQTANDGPCHKCFGGYTQTPKVSGSNPADPELNHLWRWAWKALHGFTIFTIHFGVICGYPAGILILKKPWKCVNIYLSLAMTSARCKMSRRLVWGASRLFIIVWYPECMTWLSLQTIFAKQKELKSHGSHLLVLMSQPQPSKIFTSDSPQRLRYKTWSFYPAKLHGGVQVGRSSKASVLWCFSVGWLAEARNTTTKRSVNTNISKVFQVINYYNVYTYTHVFL